LLPAFTADGLLPPGDYVLSLEELARSPLVLGPADLDESAHWDRDWRGRLVANLGVLVRQLWQGGIEDVFVDGSFVEDKDHPNDIDGYFVCDLPRLASGDLQRELNPWTRTRCNRGIRPAGGRSGGIPSGSCQCGTCIASSCIRTTGNSAACATSMGTNWSSRLPSGGPDATALREAS